jgi:2EXR family protein
MIWEMALPDRRVFEPLIKRATGVIDFDVLHLLHTYPPPVIRGVCKEAWEVTEANGRFCFGLRGSGYFGYWFNPSRDLLFINRGGYDGLYDTNDIYYDFFDHLDLYLERLKHTGACHLAFDYWYLWRRPKDIQKINRFMPCCKTITMVDAADTMVEGTPIKAWYPLLDTDVSTSGENKIGGKDRTWAEEKERILAVWASMTTMAGNLPELIGIEVVRTERVTMRDLCA